MDHVSSIYGFPDFLKMIYNEHYFYKQEKKSEHLNI